VTDQPGRDLDQRRIRGREALEQPHQPGAGLAEQVAEHLAGRPLTGRVRALEVAFHARELPPQPLPRRVALPPELDRCVIHGGLLSRPMVAVSRHARNYARGNRV
jgi:hypothetical protein